MLTQTLQGALQAQIRSATGKTNQDFNGDLHDLCDIYALPAAPISGRIIGLANKFDTSINSSSAAMNYLLANSSLVVGPAGLFATGAQGVWYDPSDSTTLFSDTAGTTPSPTPGGGALSVVGAMLDKRATNYSVFFDGTGDYLSTATSAAFAFGTGDFTLSAFIYPTTTTGTQIIIDCRAATVGNPGPVIYLNGTTLSSAKNQSTVINSGGTVAANQWSFVELTRTSGNWRLFLNGSLVAGPTTDTINYTDNSAAYIAQTSTISTQYFTGYISSARVLKGVGGTTSVVPTSPLTAISGTSLLTCGTSWTGNPTITVNGDSKINQINPFVASPLGNHAISYNTTTARPELSARVNLLTYSEQFDNGLWVKNSGSVSANSTVAPDGTTTADTFTSTAAAATHNLQFNGLSAYSQSNLNHTAVVSVKAGTHNFVTLSFSSGSADAWAAVTVDLSTGTATKTGNGLNGTLVGTPTVVSQGNGWYRISLTARYASGVGTYCWISTNSSNTPTYGSYGLETWTPAGTETVFVWGADLRPANIGTSVPAYQRIADQYTYDSSGFPRYFIANGTASGMYTPNNLNLSGTDKVTVFAGVRKLSDTTSILAELSANVGVNNGAFSVVIGSPSYSFSLRATAETAFTATSFTAPISNVISCVNDTTGATRATEIFPRINGVIPTLTGAGAAESGSGNFGTYPLNIGTRNAAGGAPTTLFFNGYIYSLIVVGAASTAAQISSTESWINVKEGGVY